MNVWTDIALANLQRQRPPPLDMDLETGEVKLPEIIQCKGPCGEWKSSTEFYSKHDKRWDKHFRQSSCKACIRERDRKPKSDTFAPTARNLILMALTVPMSCRQICEAIGRTRRPTDLALSKLMSDGLVKRAGFGRLGTNSRIPLFIKA
jgi:hypothetical protein